MTSHTTAGNNQITVALCGNPNCGKTTLFNLVTASRHKVGNRAGVTVEIKKGVYRRDSSVAVVDTPGFYSLQSPSPDERITADFIKANKADLFIVVVDCTRPLRGLTLANSLLQKGVNVAVALNMYDEALRAKTKIDLERLQKEFDCAFFALSAAKNKGVDEMMSRCTELAAKRKNADEKNMRKALSREDVAALVQVAFVKSSASSERSRRIDKTLLHRFWAYPIFALIVFALFYISSGKYCGGFLAEVIQKKITPALILGAKRGLSQVCPPKLVLLLCDGVIGGVMSVMGFVPQVSLLFGCIALLEDSGYTTRIALIFDRALRNLGLGGKSLVSLVLGCGCNVPAVASTRSISNRCERERTVALAPMMPCSAKLAIISCICTSVFGNKAIIAISFYLLCLFAIVLCGAIANFVQRKNCQEVFLLELPPLRVPSVKNACIAMADKAKSFVTKAGTGILAASVLLWITKSLNFSMRYVAADKSMLACVGKALSKLFAPIGFDDGGYGWQLTVATLAGLSAKETAVTTLQILLPQGIGCLPGACAYSFVTFNLLTTPCIATVAATFEELGARKAIKTLLLQPIVAYLFAFATYQIGKNPAVALPALAAVAFAATLLLLKLRSSISCLNCNDCNQCR